MGVAGETAKSADECWNNFLFKDAHSNYIKAVELYMDILRNTKDDAKFQESLKQTLSYLMDKAEKCKANLNNTYKHKEKAGFVQLKPDT